MFNATHTIKGVPVMRRPNYRGRGLTAFTNERGEVVRHGRGAKPEPIAVVVQKPVLVAVAEPEPVIPDHEPGDIVLFHPEVAAAILRAMTWPAVGEAIGWAETSRGDSAQLIGPNLVRVCERTPAGGRWYVVRVPDAVGFEIGEERI
jgi:hypothetical protein